MSPAQAEIEARDLEIGRLTHDLTECRRLLTEALGAVQATMGDDLDSQTRPRRVAG